MHFLLMLIPFLITGCSVPIKMVEDVSDKAPEIAGIMDLVSPGSGAIALLALTTIGAGIKLYRDYKKKAANE